MKPIACHLDGTIMDPQPHPSEIEAFIKGEDMYPGDLLRHRHPWYGYVTKEQTEPVRLLPVDKVAS